MPAVSTILQPGSLNYKIVRHLVQNIEGEPMFETIFDSLSTDLFENGREDFDDDPQLWYAGPPILTNYTDTIDKKLNNNLSIDLDHLVDFLINEFLPKAIDDDDDNWYDVPLTSLIARLELFEKIADGIVAGVDYSASDKIGQYLKSENKTEREFGVFLLSITNTI